MENSITKNPFFLYYFEKELEKYESDPDHYKSYDEWGKELDEEYKKCIAELRKNESYT